MQKFVWGTVLSIAAMIAPVHASEPEDPMVWSKHQWSSDLFGTDRGRRAHRAVTRTHRVIVVQHADESEAAEAPAPSARPKIIRLGGTSGGVTVVRGGQRSPTCRGPLILTWTGYGVMTRCKRSKGD